MQVGCLLKYSGTEGLKPLNLLSFMHIIALSLFIHSLNIGRCGCAELNNDDTHNVCLSLESEILFCMWSMSKGKFTLRWMAEIQRKRWKCMKSTESYFCVISGESKTLQTEFRTSENWTSILGAAHKVRYAKNGFFAPPSLSSPCRSGTKMTKISKIFVM